MTEIMDFIKFSTIPDGEEFAKGLTVDSPEGANMMGTGKQMRWVAVKGWAQDWCIYINWSWYTYYDVAREGDKVIDKQNIQNLVPCTFDVMARYRY